MISKTKFLKDYGHRLVRIAEDDSETGDYMLYHPEEKFEASDYIRDGYEVASVYEVPEEDDDFVEIDNDISEHPFKIGYFVLSNK